MTRSSQGIEPPSDPGRFILRQEIAEHFVDRSTTNRARWPLGVLTNDRRSHLRLAGPAQPQVDGRKRRWSINAGRTTSRSTDWRDADRVQEPRWSTRGAAMVFGSLGASRFPTHQCDLGYQRGPSGTHLRRNWTAAGRHVARDRLQRCGGTAVAAGAVGPLGDHSGRSAGSARTQRSASTSPGPSGLVRPSTG